MDRCVYEPFFKNGGTPIRCRSLDEVDRLMQDMSALFPEMSERLASLNVFLGAKINSNPKWYIGLRITITEESALTFLHTDFTSCKVIRLPNFQTY